MRGSDRQDELNLQALDTPEVGDAWCERYDWLYLVIFVIAPCWWCPRGRVVMSYKRHVGRNWFWDIEQACFPYLITTFAEYRDFLTYQGGSATHCDVLKEKFPSYIEKVDRQVVLRALWSDAWSRFRRRAGLNRLFSYFH